MPSSETHRLARALAKAKRNAGRRYSRAVRAQRALDWTPKWLRCAGCGRWMATEQVAGYGGGRVWCLVCALAADLRRTA